MYSAVSLCAGGGFAAGGMRDAGVALAGAVEYDPAIAGAYSANFDTPIIIAPIQDVDFTQYTGVDIGQFSPPCPNFSVAKRGTESDVDQAIVDAGVRFLETVRPRYFWLENVEGYARSKSYRTIRAALDRLDYWSHCEVVNAADYGVPQTRRRLILRAIAGGFMQPFRPLPAPVPWRGWYEAIADLIPDLPDSYLQPWQLKHLPQIWLNGRAYIVDRTLGDYGGILAIRIQDSPMFTIPTSDPGSYRACLPDDRVIKMTPRALARFQSVPDSYQLPTSNRLAARIIGNGVPWLLAQRITESLLY